MIREEVMQMAKVKRINSRTKGKNAEREVRDLLQPIVDSVYSSRGIVPPQIKRNLMQAMEGGHDLTGAPGIAVEVKRCETLQLDKWWDQATAQAYRVKARPVLIYRKSHSPWRVRMTGILPVGASGIPALVDIAAGDFLEWYEMYLHQHLDKKV